MYARMRLDEARYFRMHLSSARTDDEFYFNLSAFLNAWRSILDVMLYDFSEHYTLGFTREDELDNKQFLAVATVLGRTEAIEFIKWWNQQQGILSNNPLWRKRNVSFHRGYPKVSEYVIYVSGSGGTSGTLSYFKRVPWPTSEDAPPVSAPLQASGDGLNYFFTDLPDRPVIDYCDEALKEIERIIEEAEKRFSVNL